MARRSLLWGLCMVDYKMPKKRMTIFRGVEVRYRPFINAITSKTKNRLDSPLHLAAYYLNPYHFYKDQVEIEKQHELMDGVMKCLDVFFPEIEIQDQITKKELTSYMMKRGKFGKPLALRQCLVNDDYYIPADWWRLHGEEAPHLQEMAVKILSLTSSASGCERNWSTFEGVHTKKRYRLEVQKMNDLVYVNFNAKLHEQRERKGKDPLVTTDRTYAMEWIVDDDIIDTTENDDVFPGEGLSWRDVAEAAGVDDVLRPIATHAQTRGAHASTSFPPFEEDELPDVVSTDDEDEGDVPIFVEDEELD